VKPGDFHGQTIFPDACDRFNIFCSYLGIHACFMPGAGRLTRRVPVALAPHLAVVNVKANLVL
jgi:hypothetical protein